MPQEMNNIPTQLDELRSGSHIHFWIDDYTPIFAIVAKVAELPEANGRPQINLCFLSPDTAKWVSKLNIDPIYDDGTRVYKAQRWAFLNECCPDLQ